MTAFRRPAALALASVLVIAAGAALIWALRSESERSAQVALGRTLYAAHCASCHGATLTGEADWQTPKPNGRMPAPPHDASGHTWHHTDQELHRITKLGMAAVVPGYESDMPGFQNVLSDQEIAAVLAFIKSTWPAREREYQEARTQLAQGGKR